MLTFFAINVMLDLHTATDLVMTMITELLQTFPSSVHLIAQKGMVYYHMRGRYHFLGCVPHEQPVHCVESELC